MIFNLIGYFLAIVLLVYIYAVFLTFLAKTLIFVFKESKQWILQKLKKIKEDKTREVFLLDEYLSIIKKNPFFLKTRENRIILVALFIGNIIFWQYFRYKPEHNQFEHKEAREYYALSHMLLSYNMGLLVIFRNPDSIFLKPLREKRVRALLLTFLTNSVNNNYKHQVDQQNKSKKFAYMIQDIF